jgi:hypothetical protein
MSQFDDADLPPELGEVADRLRTHRYEPSPLELDQLKTRTMQRGRAAKGGGMRIRTLVTAAILFAAVGTGSAAALSIGGIQIPLIGTGRPAVTRPAASAALSMYGNGLTTVSIRCIPISVPLGGSSYCTVRVSPLTSVHTPPTGVITLTSTSGGSFDPPFCTLVADVGNSATCSITYTPTATGTVSAHYSGDANYASNDSVVGARVSVR